MFRGRLTGICILLIGAATFAVLIPAGIVVPGSVDQLALAPDFWPRIVAAVIFLMGLIMVARPGPPAPEAGALSWKKRFPGLCVVGACLFGFHLLIPYLGMVAGGTAVILILMWYAGERGLYRLFGIALSVPVILYLFFVQVARIPLPLGWFESLGSLVYDACQCAVV